MRRVKKTLNLPEELVREMEAAAARNFRDFTAEVIARCLQHTSPIHTTDVQHTYVGGQQLSDVGITDVRYTSPIHLTDVQHTSPIHTSAVSEDDEDTPQTPADMAWMIDMLLADGDPKHPKSNFQVRRKRQVEFLRTQWQEMFGKTIPDATIKQFLQLSGDSSQAVLEAMEIPAGRGITGNGTVNYVKKVLTTRAEKAKQPPQAEKPAEGKHPWDSEPVLREPTEADYAEWERAKRLWELTESGDNT